MRIFIFTFLLIVLSGFASAEQLIIQEDSAGFCSVDGVITTSVEGYTGSGYADTDFGVGKSISWSVNAASPGTYYLSWRYAVGGSSGDRDIRLLINGAVVNENVPFPHTGDWTNWQISDSVAVEFIAGANQIRIEALNPSGTGNYDYLIAGGSNLSAGECVPSFILTVDQNESAWGSVYYNPVQDYYTEGTEVTLTAVANEGYFFQSWTGDQPSAEAVFKFTVTKNVHASAIFLPDGTKSHPAAMGYATVQDDKGTPYMVIGGALGDSVHATSLPELESYLGNDLPLIITFSDSFGGSQEIDIKSNKTLLGIGDNAHLSGIGLNVNAVTNVIIRNIIVSKVTPQDAIEINGAAKHVLIDNCEFYSDREHGTEFYDGLLDIKNESSFITVSWSKFHDHYKTILISSNDQSPQDSVTRITFHHNYFYNCGSRLPSIRFGTAHIFNNYYKDCSSAINTRVGACVRVEKNYFNHSGTAVMSDFSIEPGYAQLIDNIFVASAVSSNLPECEVVVPYAYEHLLHEAEELPMLIAGEVVSIDDSPDLPLAFSVGHYPNPFNPDVNIRFTLPQSAHVEIEIYNVLGQKMALLADSKFNRGKHTLKWNATGQSSGIYFYRIKSGNYIKTKKMMLIR